VSFAPLSGPLAAPQPQTPARSTPQGVEIRKTGKIGPAAATNLKAATNNSDGAHFYTAKTQSGLQE